MNQFRWRNPIPWLLEGEPWVAYRTRIDLLGESSHSPAVMDARHHMMAHPDIRQLIGSLSAWEQEIVTSHKKADLLIHKLGFLADIGITLQDEGMRDIAAAVLSHTDPFGVPKVGVRIPVHFGGSGLNAWGWALCDAPDLVQSLLVMNCPLGGTSTEASQLRSALLHLADLRMPFGWPCAVSPELGTFRGPGKKDDPCPYATLLMLKVLLAACDRIPANVAELPYADSLQDGIRHAAECLLTLFADSRLQHPYMFHMGTDFRKVKAPFIWYDILHVADTLSRCTEFRKDARLHDMVNILLAQSDPNGRFVPQSIWQAWKTWDFGQKKVPSRWLTMLACRIAKRLDETDSAS